MADFSAVGRSNVRRSKAQERRVAKLLAEWSSVPFRRRIVSGRDVSIRSLELTADVIPLSGKFIFSVEVKCGRGFSLDALFANPKNCLFTSWWFQACYDAKLLSETCKYCAYPFLFFKPTTAHDWVAFSANAIGTLRQKDSQRGWPWFPHLSFDAYNHIGSVAGDISHSHNKHIVELDLEPTIFCRWRDFQAHIDPHSAFIG